MAAVIPSSHRDLVEAPPIAALTTLMPHGGPNTSAVWCDSEDGVVRVNTMRGFQKERNMRRDPRVTLPCYDPQRPLRYLEVRGTVTDMTEDGAIDHLDVLASKYLGRWWEPPGGASSGGDVVLFARQPIDATMGIESLDGGGRRMERQDERRAAAVARITGKREFRNHAAVYCAVNALLVVIWAASGAGYFWPIWVIGGWGIGLAAGAWRVYGQKPISEADIVDEMRRSQP